jgi:hypothetical protein
MSPESGFRFRDKDMLEQTPWHAPVKPARAPDPENS